MKMYEFRLKMYDFTEVRFYVSNYQYSGIGSDNGLSPGQRQAIICTDV